MGGLPIGDWQFWVVTAVAGGVAALLIWRAVRFLTGLRRGGSRRVTLTVGGAERRGRR